MCVLYVMHAIVYVFHVCTRNEHNGASVAATVAEKRLSQGDEHFAYYFQCMFIFSLLSFCLSLSVFFFIHSFSLIIFGLPCKQVLIQKKARLQNNRNEYRVVGVQIAIALFDDIQYSI